MRLARKFGVAAVQSKIDDAFPYHSNAAVKVHATNAEAMPWCCPSSGQCSHWRLSRQRNRPETSSARTDFRCQLRPGKGENWEWARAQRPVPAVQIEPARRFRLTTSGRSPTRQSIPARRRRGVSRSFVLGAIGAAGAFGHRNGAHDMRSGGTARITSTFTGCPSCSAGRNSQ